ncbi:MAG: hypothetical protein Q8N51_19860 [Gammaproteobacteria bacterium]|nr:hypothetical protein [Gammaproteobacteria bacterium]
MLVITNADLMPAVEQRVAREMMAIFERYRQATGVYPWADLADGVSNANIPPTTPPHYYNRNRFPCSTDPTMNALPTSWADAGITLPNWLTNGCGACVASDNANPPSWGWGCVVFYAVARNRLQNGGGDCTTCQPTSSPFTTTCGSTTTSTTTLTVANTSGGTAELCTTGSSPFTCTTTVLGTGTADLVLITPGAAAFSRSTTTNWPISFTAISNYFDDATNANNNHFNCYIVPTSTKHNRDRIYIVR